MKTILTEKKIKAILRKDLPFLREKYGVQKIAIYGSFVRGKPRLKSDVDLVVELARPLGLEFVALAFHLEKLLGRKVDLATYETLQRGLNDPRYREIASDIQRTLSYVEAQ